MGSGRHPLKCKVAFREAICAPQQTTEHGNGLTSSDLSACCSCGSRARPRIYTQGEIKKHEGFNLSSLPTRKSILREAYCISSVDSLPPCPICIQGMQSDTWHSFSCHKTRKSKLGNGGISNFDVKPPQSIHKN